MKPFRFGLLLMSLLYVVAGSFHFLKPSQYLKIMPPFLPSPLLLVYLSGAAEILLGGMLLISGLRTFAAWGIFALLIAVFPANVYMYQLGGAAFNLPDWMLLVRLPLQAVLLGWAYFYAH